MALKVSDVLTHRVRVLLRDTDDGGIQWTDEELVAWLNDACSEISRLLPESSSMTVFHPLMAGAKQRIPAGGTMLLEVLYNATDADTPGRVIRRVERHTLDNERPDWHTAPATSEAKRYVASLTDPRTFYVFPPSSGTAGCVLAYASAPQPCVSLDDAFPLPDIYSPLAVNYVCFRAMQKLLEDPNSKQRADDFFTLFINGLKSSSGVAEEKSAKARDPIFPERR